MTRPPGPRAAADRGRKKGAARPRQDLSRFCPDFACVFALLTDQIEKSGRFFSHFTYKNRGICGIILKRGSPLRRTVGFCGAAYGKAWGRSLRFFAGKRHRQAPRHLTRAPAARPETAKQQDPPSGVRPEGGSCLVRPRGGALIFSFCWRLSGAGRGPECACGCAGSRG